MEPTLQPAWWALLRLVPRGRRGPRAPRRRPTEPGPAIGHPTSRLGLRRAHDEAARWDATPVVFATGFHGNVSAVKVIQTHRPATHGGSGGGHAVDRHGIIRRGAASAAQHEQAHPKQTGVALLPRHRCVFGWGLHGEFTATRCERVGSPPFLPDRPGSVGSLHRAKPRVEMHSQGVPRRHV